jgi:ribosomal protein L14E/L6E/L27E
VDSSDTNQTNSTKKNSTKPLVLREGGERSVRRCSVVDKMSDNESEDLPPPDKFGAFLKFGDEIAPVFDDLAIEQAERRKLDAVRIEKTIIVIDRLNVAVDAAIKERIESDQLIEKLNITRLDAMQRKLVHQIETGFQALQDELDEAKERLRIATEKLYQVWADSLRLVVTWRVRCASLPEPSAVR